MRISGTSALALVLCSSAAVAGGLDRSGQSIGALFEDGNRVALSFGMVMPSVSGVFTHPLAGGFASGNVGVDYNQTGGAIKMDVNDHISFAFIIDQPFGAAVSYDETAPGYPLSGTLANLDSTGLTAVGRYKFNDTFSLHAGVRQVSVAANVAVVSPDGAYVADYADASGTGYVIGAAYERPDIALRVALTYSSAVDLSHDTMLQAAPGVVVPVADTAYSMPQSVNLEFQSGVAADTLVFGSIRWADWTETEINSFAYPDNPLVSYSHDVVTYSIGIGRKFSDQFSGAISLGYESSPDVFVSNLSPTNGYLSLQVGGTYKVTDALELTGGVRYFMLGDATTETIGAEFADNTALAAGISIAYRF